MTDQPTVRISIPATEEDIALFGTDPYYSARSWQQEWMKALERIVKLERVWEAATAVTNSPRGVSREVTEDWWARHMPALVAALGEINR